MTSPLFLKLSGTTSDSWIRSTNRSTSSFERPTPRLGVERFGVENNDILIFAFTSIFREMGLQSMPVKFNPIRFSVRKIKNRYSELLLSFAMFLQCLFRNDLRMLDVSYCFRRIDCCNILLIYVLFYKTMNSATVAQPVEDVQGDGRWMSQVFDLCHRCFEDAVDFLQLVASHVNIWTNSYNFRVARLILNWMLFSVKK